MVSFSETSREELQLRRHIANGMLGSASYGQSTRDLDECSTMCLESLCSSGEAKRQIRAVGRPAGKHGRFLGPARVLATETRRDEEGHLRARECGVVHPRQAAD